MQEKIANVKYTCLCIGKIQAIQVWFMCFSSNLWKLCKTHFGTTPEQKIVFLLSLPTFLFSLVSLALSRKQKNRKQLINKTPSTDNKSFYKFLNTQFRVTVDVLFFYDAFVEQLRKSVKESWRKKSGMDSQGSAVKQPKGRTQDSGWSSHPLIVKGEVLQL